MSKVIVGTAFLIFGSLAIAQTSLAQTVITPDASLGNEISIVEPRLGFDAIIGGATRGPTLFHSFNQFNVGEGLTASFVVFPEIQHIFARVTGNRASQIQGVLGVRSQTAGGFVPSPANLFLLNPQGIVFGPNSKLDLSGALVTTTAQAVDFANGQSFSATNPTTAPLLSISTPLGLQFGSRPGALNIDQAALISNQSMVFIGGTVNVNQATLISRGGHLNIAAIAAGERIGLTTDANGWQISDRGTQALQDINITGASTIALNPTVSNALPGQPAGNLTLQGRNIQLNNSSNTDAIVTYETADRPSGTLNLSATQSIVLDGRVKVVSIGRDNEPEANLNFTSPVLEMDNGAEIFVDRRSLADAGNIVINAPDRLTLKNTSRRSNIQTLNRSRGGQNGGQIVINTGNLQQNQGYIQTLLDGQGKAGDITISATQGISSIGDSAISSIVNSGAIGDTGSIKIRTPSLLIQDGAAIELGGANGTTGIIDIESSGDISIAGISSNGASSRIINQQNFFNQNSNSQTAPVKPSENLGIKVKARSLAINDGGRITSAGDGNGNSKDINIEAFDTVTITGISPTAVPFITPISVDPLPIFVASQISTSKRNGLGDSGKIAIRARSLQLQAGGSIDANISQQLTTGVGAPNPSPQFQGKTGDIQIIATDSVSIEGLSSRPFVPSLDLFTPSYIASSTGGNSNAQAGKITIETNNFSLKSGALLESDSRGLGNAGEIELNVRDRTVIDGEGIVTGISSATTNVGVGDAGRIRLATGNLAIRAGGQITTSTVGAGSAGTILLNVDRGIELSGSAKDSTPSRVSSGSQTYLRSVQSRLRAINQAFNIGTAPSAIANGAGGDLLIVAEGLDLRAGAEISTASTGQGRAGDIQINLRDRFRAIDGQITTQAAQASGGRIQIAARSMQLFGNSDLQSNVALGLGNGGGIDLTADTILLLDDSDVLAFARDGRGGDIRFNTSAFFAENYQPRAGNFNGNQRVDINASGGVAGIITLPDTSYVQNSLNPLNQGVTDPNQLIAKTCIQRENRSRGSLYVLGAGGLPDRPGEIRVIEYSTGTVRGLSETAASRPWQKGDPIVEPQGAYQLANGEWILSQDCGR